MDELLGWILNIEMREQYPSTDPDIWGASVASLADRKHIVPIGPSVTPGGPMSPRARYFKSPKEFGDWLTEHGGSADELLVGFWKKHTSKPSLTWPQSVDQALCHGWIDGVRRRVDDDRYTIRFTPRREGSIWSAVNMARMEALLAEGRVTDAGKAAWRRRDPEKSRVYAYEQARDPELAPEHRAALDADATAAAFFAALPPSHRRRLLSWITTAKRPETRDRRFAQLLEACAQERRLFCPPPFPEAPRDRPPLRLPLARPDPAGGRRLPGDLRLRDLRRVRGAPAPDRAR